MERIFKILWILRNLMGDARIRSQFFMFQLLLRLFNRWRERNLTLRKLTSATLSSEPSGTSVSDPRAGLKTSWTKCTGPWKHLIMWVPILLKREFRPIAASSICLNCSLLFIFDGQRETSWYGYGRGDIHQIPLSWFLPDSTFYSRTICIGDLDRVNLSLVSDKSLLCLMNQPPKKLYSLRKWSEVPKKYSSLYLCQDHWRPQNFFQGRAKFSRVGRGGGSKIILLALKHQKRYYFSQKSQKHTILAGQGGARAPLALPCGRPWPRLSLNL